MKTPSVYVPGPAQYPRILTYHEVSARFQLGITNVAPARFQTHVQFLREMGLRFIPVRGLRETEAPQSVCLTFDDGYQSFYDEVLPFLRSQQITATLFVITNFVGARNRWEVSLGVNRRQHLDWKQIRQIAAAGIEIGSHTARHKDLTRLSDTHLQQELQTSKKSIEDQLGQAVTALALPFGAVNQQVVEAARSAGYQEICGGVPGIRGPYPGVLPRYPVYRGDSHRALRRKLNFHFGEGLRLRFFGSFSRGTRWLKK